MSVEAPILFEATPVASVGGIARGDRHLAVRRDPYRQFGIDQIEAFGAQPSHQEPPTGQFHLGFRRAGDDGAIAVPDHDVADAHRDTYPAGTLDWVPPTLTVLPWPILSSIAAASHGVAMSRLMGPAPSRHQRAPKQPTKIKTRAPTTTVSRFIQRSPAIQRLTKPMLTEAMDARIGTRGQQPARPLARSLFLIRIPVGLVPSLLRLLAGSPRRLRNLRGGFGGGGGADSVLILGRRLPCHCFSIQAPIP